MMNPDELKNLIPLAVTALVPFAAKYGVSASNLTAFLTSGFGIALGIYLHWNKKKVDEDAVVVAKAGAKPGAAK
jgi:hypothetical protein